MSAFSSGFSFGGRVGGNFAPPTFSQQQPIAGAGAGVFNPGNALQGALNETVERATNRLLDEAGLGEDFTDEQFRPGPSQGTGSQGGPSSGAGGSFRADGGDPSSGGSQGGAQQTSTQQAGIFGDAAALTQNVIVLVLIVVGLQAFDIIDI